MPTLCLTQRDIGPEKQKNVYVRAEARAMERIEPVRACPALVYPLFYIKRSLHRAPSRCEKSSIYKPYCVVRFDWLLAESIEIPFPSSDPISSRGGNLIWNFRAGSL